MDRISNRTKVLKTLPPIDRISLYRSEPQSSEAKESQLNALIANLRSELEEMAFNDDIHDFSKAEDKQESVG
jgi:hypothetical protein